MIGSPRAVTLRWPAKTGRGNWRSGKSGTKLRDSSKLTCPQMRKEEVRWVAWSRMGDYRRGGRSDELGDAGRLGLDSSPDLD